MPSCFLISLFSSFLSFLFFSFLCSAFLFIQGQRVTRGGHRQHNFQDLSGLNDPEFVFFVYVILREILKSVYNSHIY